MYSITSVSLITKAAFAVSAVAVVGTLAVATGVGAAQVKPVGDNVPATKDACKKGGFEHFGFKNQGQCVSFAVHANKENGYGDVGYGDDRGDKTEKHDGKDNENDQAKHQDKDHASNGQNASGQTEAKVQNTNTQNISSGAATGDHAISGNVSVSNVFSTVVNFFAKLTS